MGVQAIKQNSIRNSQNEKPKKKDSLRHNEYYDMQKSFDTLYKNSKNNSKFRKLYNLVISDRNIMLAYRNIKSNSGSSTPGTNGKTIQYFADMSTDKFLTYIKNRFKNYQPMKVRRVLIPKGLTGKTRPLGIPNIEDRIIQQCIKQVLEPICEAKFHPHSYGFRPNRSTHDAFFYLFQFINCHKKFFIVDIDIKGFFDNVNHGKLLKQLWSLGIHDKRLLSIISAMLKAEIEGEGIPSKGVPQGGILSPLLSNIVLNELDWWIDSQWESMPTRREYSYKYVKQATLRRTSTLKEIRIVRYADDFKIICSDYSQAKRIFIATQKWLKERLGLEISPEKSKITNVKKSSTEFLGMKIKAYKTNKWIAHSKMTDKAKERVQNMILDYADKIKKTNGSLSSIYNYNSCIAGAQRYYRLASQVSIDFNRINLKTYIGVHHRVRMSVTKTGRKSKEYMKLYSRCIVKTVYVNNLALYHVHYVRQKKHLYFNQNKCDFTQDGRKQLHTELNKTQQDILKWSSRKPCPKECVEYNDSVLSSYAAQKGSCAITHLPLSINFIGHHIKPKSKGGQSEYKNIVLVQPDIHRAIMTKDTELSYSLISYYNPNKYMLSRLNKLRKMYGNKELKKK